jgi:hypothetical protein
MPQFPRPDPIAWTPAAVTGDRNLFCADSAPLIRISPRVAQVRMVASFSGDPVSTAFTFWVRFANLHQRPATPVTIGFVPAISSDRPSPQLRTMTQDASCSAASAPETPTTADTYRLVSSMTQDASYAPLLPEPIFLECSRSHMRQRNMVSPHARPTLHPPRVGMSKNTTKKSKMSDYHCMPLGLY